MKIFILSAGRKKNAIAVLSMLFCLVILSPAYGANTLYWAGAGSNLGGTSNGNLNTASNWSTFSFFYVASLTAPTSSTTATMTFTSSASITQTSAISFAALTVSVQSLANNPVVNFSISLGVTIGGAFTCTPTSIFGIPTTTFNITGGSFVCGSFTENPVVAIAIATTTYSISSGASLITTGNFTINDQSFIGSSTTFNNSGTFTISGTTAISGSSGNTIYLKAGNNSIFNFNGNTTFGVSGGGPVTLQSITSVTAAGSKVYFRGNVDFESPAQTLTTNNIADYIFDSSGTQTVTVNSANINLSNVTIGSAKNPTVIFATGSTSNAVITASVTNASLTVNGSSVLDLTTHTLNRSATGGSLALNSTASLRLSGTTGGQPGSNFPKNFSSYALASGSTVEYYGTSAQTIYAVSPSYGNLTLSNNSTKTSGGNLTVVTDLLNNALSTFDVSLSSSYSVTVGRNWTNDGAFNSRSGLVTLNTTANGNITDASGTSSFYRLTVNKTSNGIATMSNNLTVANIATVSSGYLSINDKTLTLNGNSTTATGGRITGSANSSLIIGSGSTASVVSPLYFTANVFPGNMYNSYLKNFTINTLASASLADSLNIAAGAYASPGTMLVNGTLNTSNFLTLKSDINGDARVDASTSAASIITGNTIVERYIPLGRAWRFLAIPVNSIQNINAAWQEGNTPNPDVYTRNNIKPGFGTEITYTYNGGANGFDANATNNPSIKYWDSSQNTWLAPTSTDMPIKSHAAYCLFVRGSRAVDLSQGIYAPKDATILRTIGTLNYGTTSQDFINIPANNFLLIKNPYASATTFKSAAVSYAGINANFFYVWDPKIGGTNGVGQYVTYSAAVNDWNDKSGSYGTSSAPIVQSGQAFFVQKDEATGAASVTFTEAAKSATEYSTEGSVQKEPKPVLYAELLLPTDSMKVTDGVCVVFGNQYSKGRDEFDAPKLWSFEGDKMALIRDTNAFSVECRPVPVLCDTLFFRLYLSQEPHALRFYVKNPRPNLPAKAWIVDNYLHTKTEISLEDTSLYNFTPNDDTLSYRNRFMLVFDRQFKANAIPVTKAANQDDSVISGIANSIAVKASGVSIYPNPVNNGKAMLQFTNMDKGVYKVTVYNAKGQQLLTNIIAHAGSDNVYGLSLNALWPSGAYNVNIVNRNTERTIHLKLVISK